MMSPDANMALPLILSVASVFCCTTSTLAGIVGIVLSIQAKNARDQGDLEGARAKARLALVIVIVGFTVSVLVDVLWLVVKWARAAHA
jgi:uncharacterized membrane protein